MPDELLIDVTDYTHVWRGPGILLVGHGVDLYYDLGEDRPGLLSIGLHDRLIGRPARAVGLIKLLNHMQSKSDVWFCTGADVAAHWRKTHSYQA